MNFKNACLAVAIIAGAGGCADKNSVPIAPLSNRDYILGIYLPGRQWLPTANQAGEAMVTTSSQPDAPVGGGGF